MKIYYNYLFISLLFGLFIFSCEIDPWDFRLKIKNNSNKSIFYSNSYNFPDTSFDYNPYYSPEFFKIISGGIVSDRIRGNWDDKFKSLDTLIIFIYDEETLRTYPWDTVRENYLILKRYELSYKELNDLNWTINYP